MSGSVFLFLCFSCLLLRFPRRWYAYPRFQPPSIVRACTFPSDLVDPSERVADPDPTVRRSSWCLLCFPLAVQATARPCRVGVRTLDTLRPATARQEGQLQQFWLVRAHEPLSIVGWPTSCEVLESSGLARRSAALRCRFEGAKDGKKEGRRTSASSSSADGWFDFDRSRRIVRSFFWPSSVTSGRSGRRADEGEGSTPELKHQRLRSRQANGQSSQTKKRKRPGKPGAERNARKEAQHPELSFQISRRKQNMRRPG